MFGLLQTFLQKVPYLLQRGVKKTEISEVLKVWQEHFREHLDDAFPQEEEALDDITGHSLQVGHNFTFTVTIKEIRKTVGELKNNRPPAPMLEQQKFWKQGESFWPLFWNSCSIESTRKRMLHFVTIWWLLRFHTIAIKLRSNKKWWIRFLYAQWKIEDIETNNWCTRCSWVVVTCNRLEVVAFLLLSSELSLQHRLSLA